MTRHHNGTSAGPLDLALPADHLHPRCALLLAPASRAKAQGFSTLPLLTPAWHRDLQLHSPLKLVVQFLICTVKKQLQLRHVPIFGAPPWPRCGPPIGQSFFLAPSQKQAVKHLAPRNSNQSKGGNPALMQRRSKCTCARLRMCTYHQLRPRWSGWVGHEAQTMRQHVTTKGIIPMHTVGCRQAINSNAEA